MPNLSEANDVTTYKDLDSLQQIHAILYKINNGFLANVYKKKHQNEQGGIQMNFGK